MDEAERCHRLAILDRGRLVADGTPQALTGALEGRTFLVESDDPRRAQHALVDAPGVLGVAQVGHALRLLADEQQGDSFAAAVERRLGEAGQSARLRPAAPNLEDVFVAVTRAGERERAE